MATLRQIKEQQQSVGTINKITKAMKLVASAKSQKAVKDMKDYKVYFRKIEEVMSELIESKKTLEDNQGTYWIVVLSDLGLAGGYNSNVIKELSKHFNKDDEILLLGNKGLSFAKKHNQKAECLSISELLEDSNFLTNITTKIKGRHYDDNKVVKVIYTEFQSQVDFVPVTKTILPIQPIDLGEGEVKQTIDAVVEFEPSKEELLKELENLYIHGFLAGVYRESQACEHTSRKNAMDNASTNGEELLAKLDIEYNRGRQAKITQEISEIIGGAESLK